MNTHIDPVCHMTVAEDSPHTTSLNGKAYYFCSSRCKERFEAAPEMYVTADISKGTIETYFPLVLIAIYLLGGTLLAELLSGAWNPSRWMSNFMGGFFVVFSFFKLLDLKGFAGAFSSYDLVAKAAPAYGYVYPFIELVLGIAYFSRFNPTWTNLATLIVMGISTIGVVQSVSRKSQFQCACLGTVFNLPLSTVAIFENGLMIVMAAVSLALGM